jgi:hypothetical protein
MAASPFSHRIRKGLAAVGLAVRSSATEADADSPMLISGSGAPVNGTTAAPNGAGTVLYIRTDGTSSDEVLYISRDAGANWSAAVLAS